MPDLNAYKYIIFDADHTLVDFNRDEVDALCRTFDAFGATYTDEDVRRAFVLSYTVWAEHRLNDIHLAEVRAIYHSEYVGHLPDLFTRIKAYLPVNATAEELSERFINELCVPSYSYKNGFDVFKALSQKYKLCIATNGLSKMQTERLSPLAPYAKRIFVSEDIGTIKPDKAFFEWMLSSLGVEAKDCLFIGDSISSDVMGCMSVGMPCIWFNPHHRATPDGLELDEIDDLEKLL